jgi:pyruvate/2-oxoglutarate dehydrogenase complex dihydrolipoamide dehydrogenase (E3) component
MRYDVVIVGMGSGGMVAAEFAATLDLRVAVVERHRIGGDCLWTGCVPSKALIASAKAAHHVRHAHRFGIGAGEPVIDTAEVWKRIRAVQQQVASTDDDPDRFRALGVEIVLGDATVTGPHEVTVRGADGVARALEARVVLLATGSRPSVPDVPGLVEAGFLSSENLFELERAPRSLLVVGGGPIAVEIAQSLRRLDVPVTVLQRGGRLMPRDEPELVDELTRVLIEEGVEVCLDVVTERVTVEGGRKVVHGTMAGAPARWEADEILVAAGRTANVEGLGLDALGIRSGPRGIEVDQRGRTSVHSIYACGDVAGRALFTHAAGYEGVLAVRDAFFPGTGKVGELVPWCTFTDPELAHAGMTVAEARERHGDAVDVWRLELEHNDRARADGATAGAVVVVTVKGKVVGAHILAPAAGEMIHELALAIRHGMKLTDVASLVHVYPTVSTAVGQLAAEANFARAKQLRWLVRRG